MGSKQSKSSPDIQMRLKMENNLEEFEESISDRTPRSKSTLSIQSPPSSKLETEEEEYFNKIYNKRVEKTFSAGNGVKSAPVGGTKDPEVAEAIAELEETFKVLGDGEKAEEKGTKLNGDLEEFNVNAENIVIRNEDEDSSSDSNGSARTSENPNSNGEFASRRRQNHLDINRAVLESASGHLLHSGGSTGSCSPNQPSSNGSKGTHRFQPSNYRANARVKNNSHNSHNAHSLLMQQRTEFQNQKRYENGISWKSNSSTDSIKQEWTYQPPKIDGFDVNKFKEINSRITPTAIVILREDEEGYYSPSEAPSYTKAELDLLASLEREVY